MFKRSVSGLLFVVLLASGLEFVGSAPSSAVSTKDAPVRVLERPDGRSAQLTARVQGSEVEDVSRRSETASTWARPDGSWRTEVHGAQQRFRDAKGAWRDVDLSLTGTADGAVAPREHGAGLRFPGAGSNGTISLSYGGGRTVTIGIPGQLPSPSIEGAKATYSNISPGVDMVLDALRSGFEQSWVIKDRSAVSAGGVSWSLPLKTKGLTPRQEADGSVSFVDAKSVVVSRIPTAYATDARVGTPAETTSSHGSVELRVMVRNPGQATLVVTPDLGWLTDPGTVFPVRVDPTYLTPSLGAVFDTYIQQGLTTDFSGATELKIGTPATGQGARAYVNFNLTAAGLKNKTVLGATLKVNETYAGTCSANRWDGYYMTATAGPSSNWGNQTFWGPLMANSTQTKGNNSSCAGGWVAMDVKDLVQSMANDTRTVNTIGLRANNETATASVKRFSSMETTADPVLIVMYNRAPNGPSKASLGSPAVTVGTNTFVASRTPTFKVKVTDPDGNSVRAMIQIHDSTAGTSGSLKAECTTAAVASGGEPSCASSTALPDGHFFVRSKAMDAWDSGPWTGWYEFTVAATAPATPVISCPTAGNGSWGSTPPSSPVACTITAAGAGTSAPTVIKYSVDGATAKTVAITASTDPNVAKTSITVANMKGGHRITGTALTPSGLSSTEASYGFGHGTVGMDLPVVDPMTVTTGMVKVQATGPAPAGGTIATGELQWRLPSDADASTGWNTATTLTLTADPATGGVTAAGAWDTTLATRDALAGVDLDLRVPTTLEFQICLTYASGVQCTWTGQKTRVLRVPHAFGDGFPTTDAGPGQVALWTGEFSTTATDVTVPGYTGTLSLSRTHSTFAGTPNPAAAVFGPGWTASLDGTDDGGLAGSQLIDNTRVDGTLVLVDSEGTPMVFAPNATPVRRTAGNLTTGPWPAVDADTIAAGINAKITGTGTSTVVSVTEPDGTVTTFKPSTAPGLNTDGVFGPDTVAQPGSGTTTYARDTQGRVTRILAPVPAGVNCDAALVAGCRAIDITYATVQTAAIGTPGDVVGQVQSVNLSIFNPARAGGAGMDAISVATYKYDTSGRLVSVTDPRTNLTTTYGYDGSNRLTAVIPAGQAPFTITYTGSPAKFQNVTRLNPATAGGGTATLTSVVYGVPTSGAGLPDLSATAVGAWRQAAAPTWAAAVFGQDHPVTTIDPAGVGSGEWQWADVQATDARGYTVNTASYGAGEWQRTATDYDPGTHQVTRTLSASDIGQVVSAGADPDTVGVLNLYNTATNGPANTPAGTVVTDTYGTSREMTLADGTVVQARPHTRTSFDQGSPNGGVNPDTTLGWALPTTATSTVSSPLVANGDLPAEPAEVTNTGYGPDLASWKLGQPTTSTQVVDGGSGDITTTTVYDTEGRVVAQQQPMSNGTDAGTRRTIYYTVAANATFPDCGNKPEWAGAVCKTTYAAPAGGHDLITTTNSGYNAYLAPATITETANGATRTTTTTFDTAGRPSKSSTTLTGLTGSSPVNGTEIVYDPATGQPTQQWALNATGARTGDPVTTGYDTWGRTVSYSPNSSEVTTTTFDTAGQVASVADPSGTKTFGYGTDAAGKVEHRGMPTSVAISGGPAGDLTFAGAYDRAGNMTVQKLPGALTQRVAYDTAGAQTGLTYSGKVTTLNPDSSTTVDPDGAWLGWSIDRDAQGRVVRENTPAAGGYVTGGIDPSKTIAAAPYDRGYGYDKAGQLIRVQDRTAVAGAGFDPVTGAPTGAGCVSRVYGFDKNGNRLSVATSPAAGDGSCQTATGTTTRSSTWDTGDRTTNAGYVFDAFGRQTTLPAIDAPKPGAGNVALGYYDTDVIRSITQGGVTTSWSLDQARRRSVETTGAKTTTRHYVDAGDNPAFVDVTEAGVLTRTRYGTSLGGDLGLSISANGTSTTAQLTLADPHGDVIATADITGTATPAVGITGWVDQDEYGNPLPAGSPGSLTKGVGYGWVGAKQRATLDSGLLLMGARIYNPAVGGFTSTDPVYGGNTTTYAYPTDPINNFDLTGMCSRWNLACKAKSAWHATTSTASHVWSGRRTWGNWVGSAAGTLSVLPGVGTAFSGLSLAGYALAGNRSGMLIAGLGLVTGGMGGRVLHSMKTLRKAGHASNLAYRVAWAHVQVGQKAMWATGSSAVSNRAWRRPRHWYNWLGSRDG